MMKTLSTIDNVLSLLAGESEPDQYIILWSSGKHALNDYINNMQNELETLRAQYTAACVELANCGAAERYEARMLAEGKG